MKKVLRDSGLRTGRLVDIGCGHGYFLSWARAAGWEVVGIDYPSLATKYAQERLGLHIIEADLSEALREMSLGVGTFDVVTLWHCLEHAADPPLVLQDAASLLKDQGVLLIAVPNGVCPGMNCKREDWVWCQEPYVHTVHFTPTSLTMLIRKARLRPLSIWSRDTWDANHLFDMHLKVWVQKWSGQLRNINEQAGFWFEEASRLFCYAFGGVRHWCLGLECLPEMGSELLVFADKDVV